MDENEIMEPMVPDPIPDPSPEQQAEEEAERKAQEEATFGPMRRAAEQRKQSAAITAEHDDLLADVLYELTMTQLGEEVI